MPGVLAGGPPLTAGVGHNNETSLKAESLVDIEKKPWHVAMLLT